MKRYARWVIPFLVIAFGSIAIYQQVAIPSNIRALSWSPDGTKVAFECNYPRIIGENPELTDWAMIPRAMEICYIGLDGSGFTRVTRNRAFDHSPVWSPTGSQIAFVSTPHGSDFENSSIGLLDVESGRITTLEDWPTGVSGCPSWSPDGQRLCLAATKSSGIRRFDTDLYVIDITSQETLKLTSHSGSVRIPRWSPDGNVIAYSWEVHEPPTHTAAIRLVSPMGTDDQILVEGFQWIPGLAWSPNGRYIAFTTRLDDGQGGLYVVDVSNGALTRLTDERSVRSVAESVAWAPDGKTIYFSGTLPDYSQVVFSTSLDGSHQTRLVDLGGSWLTLSPDGEYLAFTFLDARSNINRIWTMNSDGTDLREWRPSRGLG